MFKVKVKTVITQCLSHKLQDTQLTKKKKNKIPQELNIENDEVARNDTVETSVNSEGLMIRPLGKYWDWLHMYQKRSL